MRKNYGPVYAAPLSVWLIAFTVIPLSIIVIYSFLRRGFNGGVVGEFSLAAYTSLVNSTIFQITLNTFYVAVVSTAVMIALAIPASYFMARSKYKGIFMLLVIVPFWTNFLIRIYAWIAILGHNGFLNNVLLSLGIIDAHIPFMYNTNAVILVSIYSYLPFAILPLFSTIEKFDFSLIEAARDLGASKLTATMRVLLPNIRGGITTAVLFTFIPVFGNFVIPQLVGDAGSYMLGNVIEQAMRTRNWPLASAISVVLTALMMVGVLLFMRVNRSASNTVRETAAANRSGGRA